MTNELIINYPTGNTLYALLFNSIGQIWNGSAFGVPGFVTWTDYDIPLTEVAATGIYRASMPAAASGVYSFAVRLQAGASAASSDSTVGGGSIQWDGATEVALAGLVYSGAGTGSYSDTLVDETSGDPLDGVRVQLSTDVAGTNLVYETFTDALGLFVLRPDPGTYYSWFDLAGYTFVQGATVVVS